MQAARKTTSLLGLATLAALGLAAHPAAAQGITGFTPADYTLNHGTTDGDGGNGPSISGTTLTLTDGGGSEANSAFNNTQQNITNFTTTFTYQDAGKNSPGANGVTFTLENDSRGAGALGGRGDGLGYGGDDSNGRHISNSAAVVFNLYDDQYGVGYDSQTGFKSGGATAGNYLSDQSTGSVQINNDDPILVQLSYNGTTLDETLTDTKTNATYNTSYITDLSALVGGNTAYVGFTGGTGGITSTQTISNFQFTPNAPTPAPEPSSVAALALGALGLAALTLRARKRHAA